MRGVLRRELRANMKTTLIWCGMIVALVVIGFVEYAGVARTGVSMDAMMELVPRALRVMAGLGEYSVASPEGYYAVMYLWLSLMAYTQAALLGAELLAKEERDRTAEFLYCKPIRRGAVMTGKLLAGAGLCLGVTLCAWASTLVSFLPQLIDRTFAWKIHSTMTGMLLTQLAFFCLGVLTAAFAKDARRAPGLSVLWVLGAYLVSVAMDLSGGLEVLRSLTPLRYFAAERVFKQGLEPAYLGLVLALCGLALAVSFARYAKRDLQN